MPEYLKKGDAKTADKMVMDKTLFLLSENHFAKFKEVEKQMGTLQKKDTPEEPEFGK